MPATFVPRLVVRQPIATLADDDDERSVFQQVREEVDLRKLFSFSSDAREFDRYWLDHCISPDHDDRQMSMLVFADGVKCQGCEFKADTVDIYQMLHPDLNKYQCAVELLTAEDLKLEGEVVARPTQLRTLDQDIAVRYHLALAAAPDALAGLEAMGFTREAVRHFKLGWARTLVPVLPKEFDQLDTAHDIEWREVNGKQQPYQWQWRWSVPVYEGDKLRQVLYRKASAADLGAKIKMEWNAGTAWMFNGDALDEADEGVFASGWGDVMVLWQWGIPAGCGISGDGQTIRPEWLERLRRLKRPFSVTDADEAGLKLRAQLDAKVPWMRHITLPYAIGSKKDVRDFRLDGHTGDEFRALMRAADIEKSWRVLRRRAR